MMRSPWLNDVFGVEGVDLPEIGVEGAVYVGVGKCVIGGGARVKSLPWCTNKNFIR
jgi:hypothetical protein